MSTAPQGRPPLALAIELGECVERRFVPLVDFDGLAVGLYRFVGPFELSAFELGDGVKEAQPIRGLVLVIEAGLVERHSLFVSVRSLEQLVHGAEESVALRLECERATIEREGAIVLAEGREISPVRAASFAVVGSSPFTCSSSVAYISARRRSAPATLARRSSSSTGPGVRDVLVEQLRDGLERCARSLPFAPRRAAPTA